MSDIIQTIRATHSAIAPVYVPPVVETETVDTKALIEAIDLLREALKTNMKITEPNARMRLTYANRSNDSTPSPESLLPTGTPGEYRADIQVVPEDPAGKVWVYVKGMSLNLSVEGGALAGPPINTSSEQTYDTGDLSLIQIGQPPSPSPFEKLLQGNELLLVLLAAIVLLLLAISLLARRKGKPAK